VKVAQEALHNLRAAIVALHAAEADLRDHTGASVMAGLEGDEDGESVGGRTVNFDVVEEFAPTEPLEDHVVLTGSLDAAEHFVVPFRQHNLAMSEEVALVVLHPDKDEFARLVARLPSAYTKNLFYVRGAPSSGAILAEACAAQAMSFVVLSSLKNGGMADVSDLDDNLDGGAEVLDDAVALRSAIQMQHFMGASADARVAAGRTHIVIELVHQSNFRFIMQHSTFLPSRAYKNDHYTYLSPVFASGRAFSPSMLDSLVAQLYYNPDELEVLGSLLVPEDAAAEQKKGEDGVSAAPWRQLHSRVVQLPMPLEFVGLQYAQLAVHLALREKSVCLGLLRPVGTMTSPMGFVCTNPKPNTKLQSADRVFILTQKTYPRIRTSRRRSVRATDRR